MVFAWVGCHAEGIPALEALLDAGAPIRAILTLTPELAARRRLLADYTPLATKHNVPLHYITNINEPAALRVLCPLAPDVVFVIGWHQRVRPETLAVARVGMVGAHASLLPHNRGSAPINWAIIRGERVTGNTLLWLSEGVDDGEIIDQTSFPITPYDTCATLYRLVAESNREMLLRLWPRLVAGERPGRPQPRTDEPVLPRRRPADGKIDWSLPAQRIYDLIRALTRPYPGAFGWFEEQRWWIWQAALTPVTRSLAPPGTVLGPVVSPVQSACGQMVACGQGAIVLLEVESERGVLLRGPALSEQVWTGRTWNQG